MLADIRLGCRCLAHSLFSVVVDLRPCGGQKAGDHWALDIGLCDVAYCFVAELPPSPTASTLM